MGSLIILAGAVWSLFLAAATEVEQRLLTFEERVQAQACIERVYYSHVTGNKRPFDEVVPRAVLEQVVRTYLEQTVALEKRWGTPITTGLLRSEQARIESGTRIPERLAEVYQALDNDTYLIRETLVRSTLVDRLARGFVAADERIQGPSRDEAEALREALTSGSISAEAEHPRRRLVRLRLGAMGNSESPGREWRSQEGLLGRVPRISAGLEEGDRLSRAPGEVGPLVETPDAYGVQVLVGALGGQISLASYEVPKVTWDQWWSENESAFEAEEPTLRISDTSAESTRLLEEMGPATLAGLSDDFWREIATPSSILRRENHTAVWTGARMIIWGGDYFDPVTFYYTWLNTGIRYDPITDTWASTALLNAPSARTFHNATWTGSEMIIWGGYNGSDVGPLDGGRYNPFTNSWAPMSIIDAPYAPSLDGRNAMSAQQAVWTGSQLIVWGGQDAYNIVWSIGGRYDPEADRWSSVSQLGAPTPRKDHTAVWAGERMLVWGGHGHGGLDTGGSYDPEHDSWEPLPTGGAPEGRGLHTAVWTGSEMIIWGGDTNDPLRPYNDTGGAFDPVSWSWRSLSRMSVPAARAYHTAIWTGKRMVIWGGTDHVLGGGGTVLATGGLYDPASDCWAPTTVTNAPTARGGHSSIWTGSEMIVWGGGMPQWPYLTATGAAYTPGMHDACSNQPPQAEAGEDLNVECTSSGGTVVTLDGTLSSDPDGDDLTYTWIGPFSEGGGVVEGATPLVTLPLGTSELTLTVSDGADVGKDTMTVTVADTTAPDLVVSVSPDLLWPPNHRLVNVHASVAATDLCTGSTVVLVDLRSNEPDDGLCDGDTVEDIQGATEGVADFDFALRAERAGNGSGRIYMAVFAATDGEGNVGSAAGYVFVPHDQGGVTDPVDLSVEQPPAGTVVTWHEVAEGESYDVIRGDMSSIADAGPVIGLGPVVCIRNDAPNASTAGFEDAVVPAPGRAFFYLVEYFDGTSSSYGTETAGKPRALGPGGCQ